MSLSEVMCARLLHVSACFIVLWCALAISTTDGHSVEMIFSKLNFLDDKMQDLQQAVKVNEAKLKAHIEVKEDHANENRPEAQPEANAGKPSMQNKLDELERSVKASEILIRQQLQAVEQRMQASLVDLQSKIAAMELRMQATESNLEDKLLRAMEHMTAKTNQFKETVLEEVLKTNNGALIAENIRGAMPKQGNNIEPQNQKKEAFPKKKPNAKLDEDQSTEMYDSCKQVPSNVSGRYRIRTAFDTVEVYCEQIKFGGGWIVLQHRFDGQLNFYRNWTEYSEGFGDPGGEFWLGLDYVHQITSQRPHKLVVEVRDFQGNYGYALYDAFEIGSEEEQYVLKKLGKYHGTAGDSMRYSWGKKFTTADSNNADYSDFGNCAVDRQGAWWYVLCTRANLNGPYKNSSTSLSSMYWHVSTHDRRSLAYSRMMIREV